MAEVKSDIEIARAADMKPIMEIHGGPGIRRISIPFGDPKLRST